MHPNLSPHLHGAECRKVIEELNRCHSEHPYKKFFGACNDLKRALNRCLHKEYIERQKENLKSAQNRKSHYKTVVED